MITHKTIKQTVVIMIISSFILGCFSPATVLAAEPGVAEEEQFEEMDEELAEAEEEEYFYSPAEDPFIDNDAVLEEADDVQWEEDTVGNGDTVTASAQELSEDYEFGSRDAALEADDDTILSEVDERREENTKHFRLNDGTFTAVTYAYPVHEKADDDSWAEIDNTLKAAGGNYSRQGLHDKVTFYGDAGEGRMLSLEKNGSRLEWGLVTGKIPESSDEQETESDESEAETETEPEPAETELGSDEAETEPAETEPDLPETETMIETIEPETEAVETETENEPADMETETEIAQETEALFGEQSEEGSPEEITAGETETEMVLTEGSDPEGTPDPGAEEITVTGQEQASLSAASFKVSYDDPAAREAEKEHRTKLKTKSVSGTLTYTSEDLPIRLEYWLAGHDVKENLVLLSGEALEENNGSFFFRLHLEDCTVKAYDEKTVVVLDPNGEALYYIFAPYMQDAAGSESTALTLAPEKETEKGTWLIRLTPDADWIRDPKRVFPVTIDPTLGFSYQGFDTLIGTNIYSGMPNTGHCDTGTHYIGRADGYGNMRSAIKLPDLPELSESDMVIYSSVK